jgi:hypothetical protein
LNLQRCEAIVEPVAELDGVQVGRGVGEAFVEIGRKLFHFRIKKT